MDSKINYNELTEKIRKFVLASVSESRYAHSMRTAEMCKKLCLHYGVDSDKGYLSGVAHDMCKKMDDNLLLAIATRDGLPISDLEREKPSLLHGRVAAIKIKETFGITDPEILEAVANHTFGGENICPLAKLLFVADKIEPGRENITQKYLDKLFSMPMNTMVYTVLNENIKYLKKKNKKIASVTLKFAQELKQASQQENTFVR